MLKKLALSSVVAATFLTASVNADTLSYEAWRFGTAPLVSVNLNDDPLIKNDPLFAGEIVVKNSTTNTSFLAYCIDIFDRLIPADFSLFVPAGGFVDGIQGLYTNHYAKVVDATTSAAFQLAIWELVYETDGVDGLSDGVFRSGETGLIADTANAWLADLAFETAGYNLAFWSGDQVEGDDSQDLVTATPVPVPAAAGLLLLALGGLAAAGKRRRTV